MFVLQNILLSVFLRSAYIISVRVGVLKFNKRCMRTLISEQVAVVGSWFTVLCTCTLCFGHWLLCFRSFFFLPLLPPLPPTLNANTHASSPCIACINMFVFITQLLLFSKFFVNLWMVGTYWINGWSLLGILAEAFFCYLNHPWELVDIMGINNSRINQLFVLSLTH